MAAEYVFIDEWDVGVCVEGVLVTPPPSSLARSRDQPWTSSP